MAKNNPLSPRTTQPESSTHMPHAFEQWLDIIRTAIRTMPDFFRSVKRDILQVAQTVFYGENSHLSIQLLHKGKPLDVTIGNKTLTSLHPYEIPKKGILIGRHPSCQWRVPPTEAVQTSRRHGLLTCKRTLLLFRRAPAILHDLDSSYGIVVQDMKVAEVALKCGEHYRLGDVELVVMDEQKEETTPKPVVHRLRQLNGDQKGKVYELTQDTIVIGSSPDHESTVGSKIMMIVCDHPSVSRNHATILITDQGRSCKIIDPRSKNGTKINGDNLSHNLTDGRKLQDGDEISLGYIRFQYYQRDSVPIIQAAFVCLATLAMIGLLCLMGIWMSPTAPYYIRRADRLSGMGRYEKALEALADAKAARQGDVYKREISEKKDQIKRWKDTLKDWSKIKGELKQKRIKEAWNKLRPLMIDVNAWRPGMPEQVEALQTETLLEEMQKVREMIGNSIPITEENGLNDDKEFTIARDKLARCYSTIEQNYLEPLKQDIVLLLEELNEMTRQHSVVQKLLEKMKNNMGTMEARTMAMQEIANIEKHIQEMKRQGGITYGCILQGLTTIEMPLKQLAEAESNYQQNLQNIARLKFDEFTPNVTLPSKQECAGWNTLDRCRMKLENDLQTLAERKLILKRLVEDMAEVGIRNQKLSQAMSEVQSPLSSGFLDCKFLEIKDCCWDTRRIVPIADCNYDHLLGIEIFWDFLASIPETGSKWEFDSRLLDGRPFIPSFFQARRHYGMLGEFLEVMEQSDACTVALKKCLDEKENELIALVDWGHKQLSKRDDLVRRWMRMSSHEQETRKALILGGMALILMPSSGTDIKNEDFQRLHSQYLALTQEQTKRWKSVDGRKTEGERQKVLQGILMRGLPGDPTVRKALEALGRWK